MNIFTYYFDFRYPYANLFDAIPTTTSWIILCRQYSPKTTVFIMLQSYHVCNRIKAHIQTNFVPCCEGRWAKVNEGNVWQAMCMFRNNDCIDLQKSFFCKMKIR